MEFPIALIVLFLLVAFYACLASFLVFRLISGFLAQRRQDEPGDAVTIVL